MKTHVYTGFLALWGLVVLGGCMSNESEHITGSSEEIVRLKADNNKLRDSIARLSARVSKLEQQANKEAPTKTNSPKQVIKTSASKTYGLFDTLKISTNPQLLPNTCKWVFKNVEAGNAVASNDDCQQNNKYIYVDNRQFPLEDIQRTRDYQFPPSSILRTPCASMSLVLECR